MHRHHSIRAVALAAATYAVVGLAATPALAHEGHDHSIVQTRPATTEARPPLSTEDRAAREAALREKLEAFQAERAEFVAERETRLDAASERRAAFREETKTRAKNVLRNVKERFTAMIDRLDDIIVRTESRMEKLEERGVDTSEAAQHLSDAKAALAEIRTPLAATDETDVDVVATAESPAEYLEGLREKMRHLHTLLKDAHASIRAALAALGAAVANDAQTSDTE